MRCQSTINNRQTAISHQHPREFALNRSATRAGYEFSYPVHFSILQNEGIKPVIYRSLKKVLDLFFYSCSEVL